MSEPITISARAADQLRQMLEQAQRVQDTIRLTVEAFGVALDVPPGWRFDVQSMAFLPPATTPAEVGQGELTQTAPPTE